MTGADDAWRGHWLRLALLALVFSALWLAISLFSSTSSASADEAKPGSLLGTVGSVVGGVTETTKTLGDTIGEVVDAVVEPVDAAVEPVLAPVTAVVQPVVEVVPAPVGDLVDAVVPGNVGDVTEPVVDTVDQIVGSLPIVGGIVGDDTVGGVVSPVTGAVDDALGTIVGSPVDLPGGDSGPTPQLPGDSPAPDATVDPGTAAGVPPAAVALIGAVTGPTAVNAAGLLDANPSVAAGIAASGMTAPVHPGSPPGHAPPSPAPAGGGGAAAAGSGASGSGSGGASASSDAAFAALQLDALASLVLRSVDDALPSSPVYDTDSTPD